MLQQICVTIVYILFNQWESIVIDVGTGWVVEFFSRLFVLINSSYFVWIFSYWKVFNKDPTVK